jgi:dsRNA-specific ribonuclease
VTVAVAGVPRGTGDGRSKKQAEQVAARDAYATLMAQLESDHA